MLLAIFFKLSLLLSIQLVALTGAIILCIYVKNQEASKWYSFIANAIMGIVILMMVATFIGCICMACCRHHEEDGEKRMYMHKEMRFHERDREDKCERGENCRRGSMDCCKEGDEECEEGRGLKSCKEWDEKGMSCPMSEDNDKTEKKDSVTVKKTVKK